MGQREVWASKKLLVGLLGVEDVHKGKAEVSLEPGHIRMETAMKNFLDFGIFKYRWSKNLQDAVLKLERIEEEGLVLRSCDLNQAQEAVV